MEKILHSPAAAARKKENFKGTKTNLFLKRKNFHIHVLFKIK